MKTVLIIAITIIIGTGYLVAQKATSTVQTVVTERNELLAQIK